MTPIVRFALPFILLSLFVLAPAQGQNKPASTESATVAGKVTLKGKAAPGVLIVLRRTESAGPFDNTYRDTTDQTGVYRITNVPPGSYQLNVTSPGYVISETADMRVRSLVLNSGETAENINFSIVRGGVITGKITDSEGRPAIEQQVYVYRSSVFNQPQRRGPITQSSSGTTDDRGIYRIFGIQAGQYKVAVGRGEDTYQGPIATARLSYQQVFYPNVNDQTKATVIEVSEGSEATGVDISLGPSLRTFSVAGRTIDAEKSMSVPNVRFGIQRIRGEQTEFINTFVTSNLQGDFLVENLLPGKYRVFLFPDQATAMRADAIDFDVVDHDVTGIMIKLSKGGGISGVVVLETDDKRVLARLSEARVNAYVQGGPGVMGQSATSGPIGPDGTFTVSGLPAGIANLNVYSPQAFNRQRWFIIRIERDGVVQTRGIEIKEEEQVGGVRIVAAYGSATLSGVINFINGEPPVGGGINIRLTKPGETNFPMRPIQVDAREHFLAEGIPGGTYELVVSMSTPNVKPRFVRQQVTLQDNATTDVSVTMDLSPETKP